MTRGERRRRTRNIVRQRVKEMALFEMLDICEGEIQEKQRIGLCKKKKPLDCGNPRCFCCSYGRWAHGITRREQEFLLRFKEEMDELT